ncbi:hypothetical protein JB92DRAFT_3018599 [Gautieria morchelliformis]|nr:hypothetical protein JB92DRAFT_3018599 [Gautieria morchelliformis]
MPATRTYIAAATAHVPPIAVTYVALIKSPSPAASTPPPQSGRRTHAPRAAPRTGTRGFPSIRCSPSPVLRANRHSGRTYRVLQTSPRARRRGDTARRAPTSRHPPIHHADQAPGTVSLCNRPMSGQTTNSASITSLHGHTDPARFIASAVNILYYLPSIRVRESPVRHRDRHQRLRPQVTRTYVIYSSISWNEHLPYMHGRASVQ